MEDGWEVAGGLRDVAIGDPNGDAWDDLVGIRDVDGMLLLWQGSGQGSFAPAVEVAPGVTDPRALAVGDFDGDGREDIVVGGGAGDPVISLIRGQASDALGQAERIPTSMGRPVADLGVLCDGAFGLVAVQPDQNTIDVYDTLYASPTTTTYPGAIRVSPQRGRSGCLGGAALLAPADLALVSCTYPQPQGQSGAAHGWGGGSVRHGGQGNPSRLAALSDTTPGLALLFDISLPSDPARPQFAVALSQDPRALALGTAPNGTWLLGVLASGGGLEVIFVDDYSNSCAAPLSPVAPELSELQAADLDADGIDDFVAWGPTEISIRRSH